MKNTKIYIITSILCFTMLLNGCAPDTPADDIPQNTEYSFLGTPEFVNSIIYCTNEEKEYVLPDGYIYKYQPVADYSVTNQLALSTDETGSIFNACGFLDDARIRSVLKIGELDNSFVTGFIPVKVGDTIYFTGNCFDPNYKESSVMHTAFYNADKQTVSSVSLKESTDSVFSVVNKNKDNCISAIRLNAIPNGKQIAFVRFSLVGSGKNIVISINEEPIASYEKYEWTKTEQYISEEWCKEIYSTINGIRNIELVSSSNTIKFMFASDIHLDPNSTTSYTQNMGKVCAEIMRSCKIPYFVTGGDNSTQSSGFMPSDFEKNMQDLLEQLSPIPQENILLSVGNHDGATGSCEINGETLYYRYQLNNQQRSSVFFDWQKESNPNKQFDSDGTYYFLDDPATKTRYIILNSFWNKWEGEENGFVPNIQHSFFQTPFFGQQQLNWFANNALDMPSGYGAVIITHFAPDAKDFDVFKGIVDAYSNHSTYQGGYQSEYEWQISNVNVDYAQAAGEIVAVFQGHNHTDAEYEQFEKVPCINITTTGAYWAVRDDYDNERVKGTASEFAVDAVIIDREKRTIYCTRLGAGKDRKINY